MTFGSLFSGVGGLDLGMERAGLTCVWQVEKHPFRRAILARHWPDVRRHDDVRSFPFGVDAQWACDLIAGGFPCKQTSNAASIHGRRRGFEGGDSYLWGEQLRILRRLMPRWAVVENPSIDETWAQTIEGGLEGAGYAVSRLDSTAWGAGAPHLRRRLFFVAHRDGTRLAQPRQPGPSAPDLEARLGAQRDAWLQALPGVLRVDDESPGRLDRRDRIRAIGDSVCPAQAEYVGRLILEHEGA